MNTAIINKISVGTANFGDKYGFFNDLKIKKKNIFKILEYADLNGIKYLDTAIGYGESQKIIGEYSGSNFLISSKLPSISNNLKRIEDFIYFHIEKSLNELKVQSLDTFFLHNPEDLNKDFGNRILQSIKKAKKLKKIKKIGFSIYTKKELYSLIKFSPDVFQVPINIFNREFLDNELFDFLKTKNIKIEARSIFLQGLLTLNGVNLNNQNKRFNKVLLKWEEWIKKNNITKVEACLNFIKQIELLDKFVIGINSIGQLKEILKSDIKKNLYFPNYLKSNNKKIIDPRHWQS